MSHNELRFIHRLIGLVALKIIAIALIAWALLPAPARIDPASVVAPTVTPTAQVPGAGHDQ
ncbi:MAG: hypothetical protein IPK27_16030 [Rhodanobacteraceae bacterium]|nr:hypothetical protein [Rhodanobacteraceae bacterium]